MSWLENRRMQQNKKRLQRISFISKTAFSLAVGIYGWMDPAANLLGAAVIPPLTDAAIELLNNWNVDPTLEHQYFTAVEDSLARVELLYHDKHGKRKLIEELALGVDTLETFNMNLEDVIRNAETYQEQYMTDQDVKQILQLFDEVFAEEVANHDQLYRYYTFRNSQVTVDMLKRVHILLSADDKKLDNIYKYVTDIKDDTTQIKAGVQEIKTGMDHLKDLMHWLRETLFFASEVLLHSMVVLFAFSAATAFFHISIEENMTIYAVILLSEVLIRTLIVQLKELRTLWSVIATQTLFITACTLLVTGNLGHHILICSLIGVSIKYVLIHFQARYSRN